MSLNNLPEDILEFILMQLSPYGELQSCRLVNRKWDRLAKGSILRLRKLLQRCDKLDWYLLMNPQETGSKYTHNPAERCTHAAVFRDKEASAYVFGGCTAAYTTFNDLWKLDLSTRNWERLIPMGNFPSPKACATLALHKGKLVLFGGWSKSSPNPIHQTSMFFNELHIYDPVGNSWRSIESGGSAPHLAGHSVTVIGDRMIVFGGSHGSESSANVWVFDFRCETWYQPMIQAGPKPMPRYGQSQIQLDDRRILIVGGCGGPNLIFNDAWMLTLPEPGENKPWKWTEVTVTNPQMGAPQLWSHPSCKIGNKLITLSKPLKAQAGSPHRAMSASLRDTSGGGMSNPGGGGVAAAVGGPNKSSWVPPQGNLIPPRRKLLSSRSLDEKEPPKSPKSDERRLLAELQRAQSIPTIIVGEIPKLVVTQDDNSCESNSSDGSGAPQVGSVAADGVTGGIMDQLQHPSTSSKCVAISSLLPHQATVVESTSSSPSHSMPPPSDIPSSSSTTGVGVGAGGPVRGGGGGPGSRLPPPANRPPHSSQAKGHSKPSVRPNASMNREKQLEMLQRMEDYIRSRAAVDNNGTSGSSSNINFRPSSPPPKSKYQRPANFSSWNRNPMNVYTLDLTHAIDEQTVTWDHLEGTLEAPEDTILYSLVVGRGELIMFGGMRNSQSSEHQGKLDISSPFLHTITNETYIIRPVVSL